MPTPHTGTLIVTSVPGGAEVLLDGMPTGGVTPDTLRELVAGTHVVRVRREGWAATPDSLVVDVPPQATREAAFTLVFLEQEQQMVVLEAFSNVNCIGCPQLAATLRTLMAEPGHGTDRVVLVKYAANWPAVNDPHYQANPADNTARMAFYQSYLTVGIPTLVVNGALAGASGQPPALDVLRAQVDGLLQGDPGCTIQVEAEAQPGGTGVRATATLHSERGLSRAGAVLQFALVQDPVIYATPPGNQGETEFDWVMRDFTTAAQPPLPLAAEETVIREATLACQATWQVAGLHVIAFIQDPQTREILQAGHAVVSPAAAPAAVSTFPTGRSSRPRSHPLDLRGRP